MVVDTQAGARVADVNLAQAIALGDLPGVRLVAVGFSGGTAHARLYDGSRPGFEYLTGDVVEAFAGSRGFAAYIGDLAERYQPHAITVGGEAVEAATRQPQHDASLPESPEAAQRVAASLQAVAEEADVVVYVASPFEDRPAPDAPPTPERPPARVAKDLDRGTVAKLRPNGLGGLLEALNTLGGYPRWAGEPVQAGGSIHLSSGGKYTGRLSGEIRQPCVASVERPYDSTREVFPASVWHDGLVSELRAPTAVLVDLDVLEAAGINAGLHLELNTLAAEHHIAVAVIDPDTTHEKEA
jgi:hypothetical protein